MNDSPYMKRKLNSCAHCSNKTTKVVFADNGAMYFLCKLHSTMLDKLVTCFEKVKKAVF